MSFLHLELAKEEDLLLIYNWVNDDSCRKNSFKQQKIELEDHIVWYKNILNRQDILLYILYEDYNPLGQIRITIEKGIATISYSLDKNYRGQGYGEAILRMLEIKVIEEKLPITCLVGKVKYSNIASQKVFEKLGYINIKQKNFIEYTKVLDQD